MGWKNCSGWQEYTDLFLAPEGDHILYFYSAKDHHKEKIQSQEIKVDTIAPTAPQAIISVDDNGVVHLTWIAISDAANYKVWRTDTAQVIATLSSSQLTYVDSTVSRGQTYEYNVMAVDEAGNQSLVTPVSILVPVLPVVTPVSMNTTTVVPKSISDGASITTNTAPTPQVAGSNTNESVTPASTTSTTHHNWNQILLAISILIIAIGAAIGGYYGYEWWMVHRDEPPKDNHPKSKSRW